MRFNVQAFANEFALIKKAQAEGEQDQPGQERWKNIAKALAQNVGAGAIGYGLGTGLGFTAGEGLRRAGVYQGLTPDKIKTMRGVTGLLGGAGGIAAMIALNRAQRRVEDANG